MPAQTNLGSGLKSVVEMMRIKGDGQVTLSLEQSGNEMSYTLYQRGQEIESGIIDPDSEWFSPVANLYVEEEQSERGAWNRALIVVNPASGSDTAVHVSFMNTEVNRTHNLNYSLDLRHLAAGVSKVEPVGPAETVEERISRVSARLSGDTSGASAGSGMRAGSVNLVNSLSPALATGVGAAVGGAAVVGGAAAAQASSAASGDDSVAQAEVDDLGEDLPVADAADESVAPHTDEHGSSDALGGYATQVAAVEPDDSVVQAEVVESGEGSSVADVAEESAVPDTEDHTTGDVLGGYATQVAAGEPDEFVAQVSDDESGEASFVAGVADESVALHADEHGSSDALGGYATQAMAFEPDEDFVTQASDDESVAQASAVELGEGSTSQALADESGEGSSGVGDSAVLHTDEHGSGYAIQAMAFEPDEDFVAQASDDDSVVQVVAVDSVEDLSVADAAGESAVLHADEHGSGDALGGYATQAMAFEPDEDFATQASAVEPDDSVAQVSDDESGEASFVAGAADEPVTLHTDEHGSGDALGGYATQAMAFEPDEDFVAQASDDESDKTSFVADNADEPATVNPDESVALHADEHGSGDALGGYATQTVALGSDEDFVAQVSDDESVAQGSAVEPDESVAQSEVDDLGEDLPGAGAADESVVLHADEHGSGDALGGYATQTVAFGSDEDFVAQVSDDESVAQGSAVEPEGSASQALADESGEGSSVADSADEPVTVRPDRHGSGDVLGAYAAQRFVQEDQDFVPTVAEEDGKPVFSVDQPVSLSSSALMGTPEEQAEDLDLTGREEEPVAEGESVEESVAVAPLEDQAHTVDSEFDSQESVTDEHLEEDQTGTDSEGVSATAESADALEEVTSTEEPVADVPVTEDESVESTEGDEDHAVGDQGTEEGSADSVGDSEESGTEGKSALSMPSPAVALSAAALSATVLPAALSKVGATVLDAPMTGSSVDVAPSYSEQNRVKASETKNAEGNLVLTESEVVTRLAPAYDALFGVQGTALDVSTVLIRVRTLGSYYDALTHVRRNGAWEQVRTFDLIPEEALAILQLKADSYKEGYGSPLAINLRFTPGIPVAASFDYADEEAFVRYPEHLPAQQYVEELRMFPRTGANIPAHMNEALSAWNF